MVGLQWTGVVVGSSGATALNIPNAEVGSISSVRYGLEIFVFFFLARFDSVGTLPLARSGLLVWTVVVAALFPLPLFLSPLVSMVEGGV
jgi:hypothetical protein